MESLCERSPVSSFAIKGEEVKNGAHQDKLRQFADDAGADVDKKRLADFRPPSVPLGFLTNESKAFLIQNASGMAYRLGTREPSRLKNL